MPLTPLDVKQKTFEAGFRGFVREQVEEYLRIVSEQMEDLVRDNNALKEQNKILERDLAQYADREKSLKETLLTAQKIAEDVKEVAEREAQVIISNAEIEGEKLIQQSLKRRQSMISELQDLKRQKVQFESTMRNAIEMHLKMLDALREYDESQHSGSLSESGIRHKEDSNEE